LIIEDLRSLNSIPDEILAASPLHRLKMLRSQKKQKKINSQGSQNDFLPFSPTENKKILFGESELIDRPNTSPVNLLKQTMDTVDEENMHISELRN
jgi:hypothetical protein